MDLISSISCITQYECGHSYSGVRFPYCVLGGLVDGPCQSVAEPRHCRERPSGIRQGIYLSSASVGYGERLTGSHLPRSTRGRCFSHKGDIQ